ncbi:MAG TPA: hypothetical protein PLT76_10720 [Candidatus Omnitrophota bacterium]|nr:hypothetical protein [Candidatus Omnitrophota bacterium]HQO59172.1 hypothetical protein [Candidatus Omnitrophota bacterium]
MIQLRKSGGWLTGIAASLLLLSGCTVKAVGDPERPITINAHVTIDIRGLQNTAASIEDYVSGEQPQEKLPVKS